MSYTFEDHAVLAPPEKRSRKVSKDTQKRYIGAKVNLK